MLEEIDREAERKYLSRCMDAFMEHLDRGTFDDKMGKFTIFGGEPPRDPLGYYDTYSDAINAGYRTYKLGPFMVQQITMGHKIFGRWGNPKIGTPFIRDLIKGDRNGSLTPLIPPREEIP